MGYLYHIAEPQLQAGRSITAEASFGASGANECLMDKIPSAAFASKSVYNPTHDQTSIKVADVLAYIDGIEKDWPQEAIFKIGFVRWNPSTSAYEVVAITWNNGQATSGVISPGAEFGSDVLAQAFAHKTRNARGGFDNPHYCCTLVTFPTANIATSGTAAANATTINLSAPLTRGLAAGAVIPFASGKTATLSQNAKAGDSSLTVNALAAQIDAGDTATYNKGVIPNSFKAFNSTYMGVAEFTRLDATGYDPHNPNAAAVLAVPAGVSITSGGYRPRVIAGESPTLTREAHLLLGDSVGQGTGHEFLQAFLCDVGFLSIGMRFRGAAATNVCQNGRNLTHLVQSIDQAGGSRILKLAKYFHYVTCQLAHNSVSQNMAVGASVTTAGTLKEAYHKLCQAVAAVNAKTRVAGMFCGPRATDNASKPPYSTIANQLVQNQATQKAWYDWMAGGGTAELQGAGNANFVGFVNIYDTAVDVGPAGNKKTRKLGLSASNTASADFGKHALPLFSDPTEYVMNFVAANSGTRQDLRIEGLNVVDFLDLTGFTIVWDADTTTVALRDDGQGNRVVTNTIGVVQNIADTTAGNGNVRLGSSTTFVAGDKGRIIGRYLTDGAGIHQGGPGVAVMARSVAASMVIVPFDASPAAPANQTAANLRALIVSGYASGTRDFVLPAGTLSFEMPVYLTEQYLGLRIRGAGALTIKGDSYIKYAFYVGPQITLHNLYGLTNQTNVALGNLAEGTTFFTPTNPAQASQFAAGDKIVVWDDSLVTHNTRPDVNSNHVEPTKVSAVVGNVVYLDRPLGRDFVNCSAALMKNLACADIAFENITFDGTIDGDPSLRNDGLVKVDVAYGLRLKDLTVKNFGTRAVVAQFCRDVLGENVVCTDGANPGNPGSGYGLSYVGGRFLRAFNCRSTNTRHGFITHNGAMDVLFDSCVADGPMGNFDTHGCGELRVTFVRCKATDSINLGSGAWTGGGRDFTVTDCEFGGPYHDGIGVQNALFVRTTLTGISADGGTGEIEFVECDFPNLPTFGLLFDDKPYGKYRLRRCTLKGAAAAEGVLLKTLKNGSTGLIELEDCDVDLSGMTGGYAPVYLSNNTTSLVLRRVTLTNPGNAAKPYAIETTASYLGKVLVDGFTYDGKNGNQIALDPVGAVASVGTDFPPPLAVLVGYTTNNRPGTASQSVVVGGGGNGRIGL